MNYDPIYLAGVQKAVNELCKMRLSCDGQFGPKSYAGLKYFQSTRSIPQTGEYDAPTQAILDPFIKFKYLTFDSITKAANSLGVSTAHVRTVCDVESGGAGFLPDGRVKILFERHHFLAALQKKMSAAKVAELMRLNPDIISATPGGYAGNEGEYPRYLRACAIDQDAAYYATSYGMFQVMGFNYESAGYKDLKSFVKALMESETNHLMAFVQFNKVYAKGGLWTALKNQDWATYARTYNGSAYKKNEYDTKLKNSFDKFSKNIFAY